MPVCRIISKKVKSTDKVVQSIDETKPFKVVMPPISKKLEIGSMRHYTAYICDANKNPIKKIDPEVLMSEYGVTQGTFIFIASNDALPNIDKNDAGSSAGAGGGLKVSFLPQEGDEADREAREKADREAREEAEKANAEKEAREKADREAREEAEKANAEKEAREKADREAREEAEKANAEKEAREKADREAREEAEKANAEKEAREKADREAREEAEKANAEKEAREKADREAREEADKANAEKADREAREEAEKANAEKAYTEKEAREKADELSKLQQEKTSLAKRASEAAAAHEAEMRDLKEEANRRYEAEKDARKMKEDRDKADAEMKTAYIAHAHEEADCAILRARSVHALATMSSSPLTRPPSVALPNNTPSVVYANLNPSAKSVLDDCAKALSEKQPMNPSEFLYNYLMNSNSGRISNREGCDYGVTHVLRGGVSVSPVGSNENTQTNQLDRLFIEMRRCVDIDRPLDVPRYLCEYLYKMVHPSGPGPFVEVPYNSDTTIMIRSPSPVKCHLSPEPVSASPRTCDISLGIERRCIRDRLVDPKSLKQRGLWGLFPRKAPVASAIHTAGVNTTRYEEVSDPSRHVPVIGSPVGGPGGHSTSPHRHCPWPNTAAPYAPPSPKFLATMVSEMVRREVDSLSPMRNIQRRHREVNQLQTEIDHSRKMATMGANQRRSLSEKVEEMEELDQLRNTMQQMMEAEKAEKERLKRELEILRAEQLSRKPIQPASQHAIEANKRVAAAAARIESEERLRLAELNNRNFNLDELIARYRYPAIESSSSPSNFTRGQESTSEIMARKRLELARLEREKEQVLYETSLSSSKTKGWSYNIPDSSPFPKAPLHFTPVRDASKTCKVTVEMNGGDQWRKYTQ